MSTCCSEPGCRRAQPITFYVGDLSGTAYAVTRSEPHSVGEDGRLTMRAVERHDVTDALQRFLRKNREWVGQVLSEKKNDG